MTSLNIIGHKKPGYSRIGFGNSKFGVSGCIQQIPLIKDSHLLWTVATIVIRGKTHAACHGVFNIAIFAEHDKTIQCVLHTIYDIKCACVCSTYKLLWHDQYNLCYIQVCVCVRVWGCVCVCVRVWGCDADNFSGVAECKTPKENLYEWNGSE